MKGLGRLTFVTQWFTPEPSIVPDQIAAGFASQGFEVTVLTGVPNYPTGEVQGGYRAFRASRESREGLRLRRTPLYPSHDQSTLKRILNYLSWAVSSTVLGQRELRSADVNVVYGSPITAALPALAAKTLWRKPFVLIVQDVWPDSVFATGFLSGRISRFAHLGLSWFCDLTYRAAGRVIVISPGMKSLLAQRGVPETKIEIIYNWTSLAESIEGVSLREAVNANADDKVILYAGNHGPAQALSFAIEAAAQIKHGLRLVMVGGGVEKPDLEALAARLGADHVHFLESQSSETIRSWMPEADVQLVSLADNPLFSVTLPSKLQACMASGSAVLVIGSGDAADIVRQAGCGEVAAPQDVPSIVDALERLLRRSATELKQMGAAASHTYRQEMSREVGEARYAAVAREVRDTGKDD